MRRWICNSLLVLLLAVFLVPSPAWAADVVGGIRDDNSTAEHTHSFGEWEIITAATCEESGARQRVCDCGEQEAEDIPATGHTEVLDRPVLPTCTESGLTMGVHCETCGTVIIAQKTLDAIGHVFGLWNETTSATCSEPGEARRDCIICDHYETRQSNTRPHSLVIDRGVASTCTEPGLFSGMHCEVCGEVTVPQEVMPATGHVYSLWNVTIEATCTEAGEERRDCIGCDLYETRVADPTGHTEVIDEAVAATCTEDGKTEGTHCSACNTVLKAQEVVPATGHTWDEGQETTAPTATATGIRTYTCTVCGETREEAIPATGETVLWGDVNGDGWVDSFDASLIMKYDVMLIGDHDLDLAAADVSGDGFVDSYDASLILKYDVMLITRFPVEE